MWMFICMLYSIITCSKCTLYGLTRCGCCWMLFGGFHSLDTGNCYDNVQIYSWSLLTYYWLTFRKNFLKIFFCQKSKPFVYRRVPYLSFIKAFWTFRNIYCWFSWNFYIKRSVIFYSNKIWISNSWKWKTLLLMLLAYLSWLDLLLPVKRHVLKPMT